VASALNGAAEQLNDWFRSVLSLTQESLFGIVPEGPHREAVVLDTLKRNARALSQSELDNDGKLYSPLCFFLAAACRTLETPLAVGQSRAALHTVVQLEQAPAARAKWATVGLEIGSPATIFKLEFDEAINQAALLRDVSYLSKEDRQVALGLAINWGMRLLLAYASECSLAMNDSNRKDLAWVANLMRPLITASGNSH
jgi:hypothetical protein